MSAFLSVSQGVSAHAKCGSITAVGVCFLFSLTALLSACGEKSSSMSFRGEALGTFYAVTIAQAPRDVSEADARRLVEEAFDRVNRLMSTYQEQSELSRFNQNRDPRPFPLSPETRSVFEIAQTVARQSDGAFDITVGPLVNAWGFGPTILDEPPDEETLRGLLERVGYWQIELHPDGGVSKKNPEVYCDLSAVAKGYAVDVAAEAFEGAGIPRYMIELGGEIRVSGTNPDNKPWSLGIEAPLPDVRELHAVVLLEAGALATSGDYRNIYELDGRMVSHTINPKTGYPVHHSLASVSVIHPSCAWADAYATALMAMGPEPAHDFALEHDLAVMLILHVPAPQILHTITTPNFDNFLK